jgi:hypothetical protein
LLALPIAAWPWTVNIASGPAKVYLQVGDGTFSGGTYLQGGTPVPSSQTNVVSVAATPANFGTGPLTMNSDSTASTSMYDGASVCPNAPGPQVYLGGFYRANSGSSATLTVTSPVNLISASSQTIPFSSISWTTGISRSPDTVKLPAGTFVGGTTQTLSSVTRNTWFEDCYTFSYDNSDSTLLSGTYTGQVTYTLTAP